LTPSLFIGAVCVITGVFITSRTGKIRIV
jgi:hypothetical protein